MALKFTQGSPTNEGLYAFSSNGKKTDFYGEINSKTKGNVRDLFYCYLGPIPVIEAHDNLKQIYIQDILDKMINEKPIIIKCKRTGETLETVVPFCISKVDSLMAINNKYWVSLHTFWEKVE